MNNFKVKNFISFHQKKESSNSSCECNQQQIPLPPEVIVAHIGLAFRSLKKIIKGL